MGLSSSLSPEQLLALASTGDDASTSLRWLEMLVPSDDADANRNSTLKVIENTNNLVGLIKTPLNLISVMGPARSGKSTLMNLLAGCKTSELFATSNGFETFTKGVYIPTRVLTLPVFSSLEDEPVVEATQSDVKVTFIDTEGQGAVGNDYDMNLFSPALVASRVIIYNRTGGLLTEQILGDLGMMTQAAIRLRPANAGNPDASGQSAIFGHLFILFNQFSLIGTADGMKKALLSEEKGSTSAINNRNKIRRLLAQSFESVQVFTLPNDLKLKQDRKKNFLLLDDFGDKFLESFKLLRSSLSTALVTPRELVKGVPLTGGSMADFMPQFVDAINIADPLNLPTIFEGAQNNAINKAVQVFKGRLEKGIEDVQRDLPKPTNYLTSDYDLHVPVLMAALVQTLSYMPSDVIGRVKSEAQAESDKLKTALLDTNLAILVTKFSKEIMDEAIAISHDAESVLKAGRTISLVELNTRCANLLAERTRSFATKVESFDARAMPKDYEALLSKNLDMQKDSLVEQVDKAWMDWVSGQWTPAITALISALTELKQNTSVGDKTAYTSGESKLAATTISDFDEVLNTKYFWTEKETVRGEFKGIVGETCRFYRADWDNDEAEKTKVLDGFIDILKLKYKTQLDTAIRPHEEPNSFEALSNSTAIRDELIKYCKERKFAEQLVNKRLLELDTYLATEQKKFALAYNAASGTYRTWLEKELDLRVPLLMRSFLEKADEIPLRVDLPTSKKQDVDDACEKQQQTVLSQLGNNLIRLGVRKDGLISSSIVQTATAKLIDYAQTEKKTRLARYDEQVSAWNQLALVKVVEPIITAALDDKYENVLALDLAVKTGKSAYDQNSVGDKTPNGDAEMRWGIFTKKQYPILVDNIKNFTGFVVKGLDPVSSGTKEVHLHVIKNVYRYCAQLASSLNMAWTYESCFDPDKIESLKMEKDPDNAYSESMTYRMKNEMSDPGRDNYRWHERYNMEFFGWSFKVSEIVWGAPIVTELKPLKVDSYSYSAQPDKMEVEVGAKSTETSIITNTRSRTIGFKLGAEAFAGQEGVVGAKISREFNASWTKESSDTTSITYETSTVVKMTLPPNRATTINQLVFNQRTSLPYTAKIKFVPKVRYKGGFLAWGGNWDGDNRDYKDNPRTGAFKPGKKGGDPRPMRDYDFGRCDEIREMARLDKDPWDWTAWKRYNGSGLLDQLADPKTYEVYIRGKFEGLTGKLAVTTVVPQSTTLSALPL